METDWLAINDKYKAEVARYLNNSIKWLVLISCFLLLVVQFDLAVYGFYDRYDMFYSRIMMGQLLTVLGGGALVTYFYRHLLIPNRFLFCYIGLLTLCWLGYLGCILYVDKNIVRGVIDVVDILILTLSISLFPHRKLTLVTIFTLVCFSCFIHIWSIPDAWIFAFSKMLLFVAVVLSGQKVMETWFIRAVKRDIEKQKLIAQFRRMALIDGLTNVSNRRHFDETLALEIRACERNQQPLSLILIDIDHFKLLNDSQGHQAGDEALIALSSVLSHVATRPRDLCARVGGRNLLSCCRKPTYKVPSKLRTDLGLHYLRRHFPIQRHH